MNTIYRDRYWLTDQYIVQKKSRSEIAEYCEVTEDTITTWLQKFDIPIFVRPPMLIRPTYSYRTKVVKVVDGDTLDVDIDVGFDTTLRKRIRLFAVDAWEIKGDEIEKGQAAKCFVERMVASADRVYVQTIMDDVGKFGRVLAWVWIEKDGETVCLNREIV